MSRSNDPGHYFQTTEALATTERKAAKAKNKHGDPIKLPSKILAATSAGGNAVYVAEAAGEVKRVDLESKKIERIFSGSNAPLTCLSIDSSGGIWTGGWDKTIYHIPSPPSSSSSSEIRKLQGHTDFIKTLLWTTISSTPILLSGGADATIILWDAQTGKLLHKLKGHTKALQHLAIDPETLTADSFTLFSASSDREIRRWHISLSTPPHELPDSSAILAHETSVYAIHFDSSGDLWTASADKTAQHLVRERKWEADTTLQHPDFVRAVLPFEELGLVVTACRDEEVRVWEMSSGELVCTYSGHFEEVTALVPTGDGRGVVSVSIDGTVRRWSLERAEMVKYLEEVEKEKNGVTKEEEVKKEGMLTAEEEAELAELMDDDDD